MLSVIDETLTMESNRAINVRDRIVEEMHKNPKITRNELATILCLTPDGVKYHLQKMTQEAIITRHGSARGGYWVVLSK